MTRETALAAALESRAAYCDELASLTVGGLREMHRTNAELFRRAAAALATPPEPAGERADDLRCEGGVLYRLLGTKCPKCSATPYESCPYIGRTPPQPLDGVMAALRVRLTACEASLAIFDEGHDSEYWLRYALPKAVKKVRGVIHAAKGNSGGAVSA